MSDRTKKAFSTMLMLMMLTKVLHSMSVFVLKSAVDRGLAGIVGVSARSRIKKDLNAPEPTNVSRSHRFQTSSFPNWSPCCDKQPLTLIMNTNPSGSIIGAPCCFQELFTREEEERWKCAESNRENRPLQPIPAWLPLLLISDVSVCLPRLFL